MQNPYEFFSPQARSLIYQCLMQQRNKVVANKKLLMDQLKETHGISSKEDVDVHIRKCVAGIEEINRHLNALSSAPVPANKSFHI